MSRGCNCLLSEELTSAPGSGSSLVGQFVHQTDLLLPSSASRVINGTHDFFATKTANKFIILIYCQHTNDTTDTKHLEAPAYDLDAMTRWVQSTTTATQCHVYILTDIPVSERVCWFEYKRLDDINARSGVIDTIREAGQKYTSGLIFYGGHSERDDRGACLVPRPGNRIYGQDIATLLPCQPKSTIGCIFDGCYMGTFFNPSSVPYLVTSDNGSATYSIRSGVQTLGQLIVVSAAKANQQARTIRVGKQGGCSHGVLLAFLLYHLKGHGTKGVNPIELVAALQPPCPPPTAQNPTPVPQEPFIASRRPLSSDDFRNLPIFS